MTTTQERMIKIFNQMDCPYCGKKIDVSFTNAENDSINVVVPTSSCCERGGLYVAQNYQMVFNQALKAECEDILNN